MVYKELSWNSTKPENLQVKMKKKTKLMFYYQKAAKICNDNDLKYNIRQWRYRHISPRKRNEKKKEEWDEAHLLSMAMSWYLCEESCVSFIFPACP